MLARKILTVVCNLRLGGTQRAAQNFARAYKNLGHDSRVVGVYDGGVRTDVLRSCGVHVWESYEELCRDSGGWIPDIVHFHSHALSDTTRTEIATRYAHAKKIETNVFSSPTNIEGLLEHSFQLSNWCAFRYMAQGGDREKCRVLGNPVDAAGFYKEHSSAVSAFKEKFNIPSKKLVVGRVGQPGTFNWSGYLVDVFASLINKHGLDLHLLLCGPPKQIKDRLENDHSLAGKYTIIDKLETDGELRACFSSMDLLLHIADAGDTFGMVIAESLLCETPVISLRTPWEANSQSEVIGWGEGGAIASTIQAFEIEAARFLGDRMLRESKGTAGRAHILREFSEQSIAERALRIANGEKLGVFRLRTIFRDAGSSIVVKALLCMVFAVDSVKVRRYAGAAIRRIYRYSFVESGRYEQEKALGIKW